MSKTIRILVIDDSPFVCRLLTNHLQTAADLHVVASAFDGKHGLKLVDELKPDVITLDLEMPGLSGLETLQQIMHDHPTPVVMISGISRRAARLSIEALSAGAVDFILKYTPGVGINPEALRQEIVAKVKAAAGIKVVRSIRPHHASTKGLDSLALHNSRVHQANPEAEAVADLLNQIAALIPEESPPLIPGGVVVIGASTGGPVALRELLSHLPASFPAAIVIVQHMPATFTGVLATQLNNRVALRVKEAQPGDALEPGLVLVAPGDFHLLVYSNSQVLLNKAPKIQGHRPSVDVTMQSVAQIYGVRAKGVVLTGMGSDGALGLMAIRAKGGQTFAQDAESCVVNGMPQQAINLGVVDFVAPPAKIATMLSESLSLRPGFQPSW